MFAAAFPLAPLIALITNLIDIRVDARRMLWFNRRPNAERAEDIGKSLTQSLILAFSCLVGMFLLFIDGFLFSSVWISKDFSSQHALACLITEVK